jgi:hypothetical protein
VSVHEEKAMVGAFVATAMEDPTPENIEGAIGALAAASPQTFDAAMKAIRATYPEKWPQISQFEVMVVGLRGTLRK